MLDSFNLEERERVIYTPELESAASIASHFDRYRDPDLASASVISSQKIVSAAHSRHQPSEFDHSNWFECVDLDNFRSVGLEGQPGVVELPANPILAPAKLTFARILFCIAYCAAFWRSTTSNPLSVAQPSVAHARMLLITCP